MKTNHKLFLWLGIILLIIPFLGIPQSWKDFVLFVVGLILVAIGLSHRNQEKLEKKGAGDEEIFVENDVPLAVSENEESSDVSDELISSDEDEEFFDEEDEDNNNDNKEKTD